MAGLDSLLKMVRDHDADELRLGTDRDPRISKGPAPVRTTLPATSDSFLRILLEPVLTPELEKKLRAEGRVDARYESPGQGGWAIAITRRGNPGPDDPLPFDVIVKKAASAPEPVVVVPAPTRAPVAPLVAARTRSLSAELLAILRRAAQASASDVHLLSGEPASIRVDGNLRPLDAQPVQVEPLLQGALDAEAIERLDGGRSFDDLVTSPDGRFRLNVYRVAGRLAAAIRILPSRTPSLEELHMPVPLDDCVASAHGLVLVCGPTGSGKSATLAALAEAALALGSRRGQTRLLITLEDPVEYVIRGPGLVRQRQIGGDARDFAGGLRDALREDPDILLIGEMRDPETISLAITAAETGHLVLSSVHSRSAASTVDRIVDSYPSERQPQLRVQLADSLRAIISQRLLRARAGGRIPAVEVLRNTLSVGSLIREGKTTHLTTAIQSGRKDGMVALERTLADLVNGGAIERDDAFAAANDTATLRTFLGT